MEKLMIVLISALLVVTMMYFYLKPEPYIHLDKNLIKVEEPMNQEVKPIDLISSKIGFAKSKNQVNFFNAIDDRELLNYKIPDHLQRKNLKDTLYFTFNHSALGAKKEGDQISFQMLKFGINRIGVINNIERLEEDIVRFTGSFKQYPKDINYFTVTQTKKDAYAIVKIFTDKGAYIAEIKDGIGLATPMNSEIDQGGIHSSHE